MTHKGTESFGKSAEEIASARYSPGFGRAILRKMPNLQPYLFNRPSDGYYKPTGGMQNLSKFFVAALLVPLVSLAACRQAPSLWPELKEVDSLVWEQPDSALAILTRMPKPSPSDRLNDATWCLLYTQARDKCYLKHTSDSVINVAVRYFERRDDWRRKAQAWFYRGQVEMDRRNIKEAVGYYVKAKDILDRADDPFLAYSVYSSLGSIYRYRDLYDASLEELRLCVKEIEKTGRNPYWSSSYSELGRTFAEMGQWDSAQYYFSRSLENAKIIRNKKKEAMALNELSAVYQARKKFDLALLLARENISLKIAERDTANLPQGYYGLGRIFYSMGNWDSAKVYFNKSLHTDNLYTLSNAYLGLSYIAREENNDKAYAEYRQLYKTYHDSVYKKPTVKELVDVQSDYNYNKLEATYHQSEHSSFYQQLLFGVIILFLLIGFYCVLRKKNRKISQWKNNQQALADYKTKMKQAERDIHLLQAELESRKKGPEGKDLHLSRFRQNMRDFARYFRKMNQPLFTNIHVLKEDELSLLVRNADLMYDNFSKRLRKAYPSLRDADIYFCCLLKLGFSTGEIAKMYSISESAVLKRKRRIADRLPLSDPLWSSVKGDINLFIELL